MQAVIISDDPRLTYAIMALVTAGQSSPVVAPAGDAGDDQHLLAMMAKFSSCREIARHIGLTVPETKRRLISLYRRPQTRHEIQGTIAGR